MKSQDRNKDLFHEKTQPQGQGKQHQAYQRLQIWALPMVHRQLRSNRLKVEKMDQTITDSMIRPELIEGK